jgi:hypothetical protein
VARRSAGAAAQPTRGFYRSVLGDLISNHLL